MRDQLICGIILSLTITNLMSREIWFWWLGQGQTRAFTDRVASPRTPMPNFKLLFITELVWPGCNLKLIQEGGFFFPPLLSYCPQDSELLTVRLAPSFSTFSPRCWLASKKRSFRRPSSLYPWSMSARSQYTVSCSCPRNLLPQS